MAAPYKSNTLKGVLNNVEANRQYVNNAVGEFADTALDNFADNVVSVDNQIRENLHTAYNDAANAVDAVGTFFTGDPVLAREGKTMPSVNTGQLRDVAQNTPVANVQDVNSPLNQGTRGATGGTQGVAQGTSNGGKMNANLNFNQYGDDSSPENQTTPGGLREKNTGEGVATSNVVYNPNADINSLNYKFGEQGRQENGRNAGYLARRNDEIASALYNAGLTTTEDIAYFLAQQPGWMDGTTELDRVNTVTAIWKRIGEIAQTQEGGEQPTVQGDYADSVIENMQSDLAQVGGTIYGKTTADEGNPEGGIPAMVDANNIYAAAAESRMAEVKAAISMGSDGMSLALAYGDNNFSENTLRDIQTYAPEFWAEVQTKVKNIQAGDNANAIASGEAITTNTAASINNVNNGVNSWAESNASTPQQASYNIANVSTAMASNQNAASAVQLIDNLNAQIEDYQMKISNLEKEANKIFKGDVPDYIVNAYINNRRLKYQEEITKLEGRRDSALDMYKFELNYELDKQGMNLKYLEYQRGLNNDSWERWYKEQQLNMDNVKIIDGKAYKINNDGTMTQLTDSTAYSAYQADVNTALQGYAGIYTSGGGVKTHNGYKYNVSGGQCQEFTNNFTEMTTGLRMNGIYAADKLSYWNTNTPTVGSVAIAVGGVYDSVYGHTMLVTGYDPSTGIVDLLWSNNGGDELVYSTQDTLSNLYKNGLKGFWDPYLDLVEQNGGDYMYSFFNNPMSSAFSRISNDSSLSATQRNNLPIAMEMYNTLYEIANNGQLDALVTNGDLALILNDFKNKRFSNADKGEKFLDAFTKALNNKAADLAGGEDSYLALMALQRVIEAKLRDESGAAISSSEWATNFSYLLPQAGESIAIKQGKLDSWDRIISTKFIAAGGKLDEYVPIFSVSTVREIW